MTGDDVTDLGKKVLKMEREFNQRPVSPTNTDRLPDFFKDEQLPPHNVTFAVTDEELDQVFNF